jgi:hypothetical protein
MDPTTAACQNQVPQDHITGSVRNHNGMLVDNVAAIFTFLDGSGNAVAQNSAMVANGLTLAVGASGNFTVGRANEPGWSSVRLLAEPAYPADLNPDALSFGDQLVGTPSPTQTITLSNNGTRTLNVSQLAASGDFSQVSNCAAVAAGKSCSITVGFTPAQMAPRSGTLTFTSDGAGTPYLVPLSGNGVAPIATLSTTNLEFPGLVNVGASAQLPVTLSNTGTAPLLINSFATSGDFSSDASQCPAALDPNIGCTITVTFAPHQGGPRRGQLSINDSAAGSPHLVALSGSGAGPGVGCPRVRLTSAPRASVRVNRDW